MSFYTKEKEGKRQRFANCFNLSSNYIFIPDVIGEVSQSVCSCFYHLEDIKQYKPCKIPATLFLSHHRPFLNYLWPLFQSKPWCSSLRMKTNFHSQANDN